MRLIVTFSMHQLHSFNYDLTIFSFAANLVSLLLMKGNLLEGASAMEAWEDGLRGACHVV